MTYETDALEMAHFGVLSLELTSLCTFGILLEMPTEETPFKWNTGTVRSPRKMPEFARPPLVRVRVGRK